MPRFRTFRKTHHSASDMFNLVADVESYPQFVPLCTALRVRKREKSENDVEILIADMQIGYKAIREKFSSKVTLDRPKLTIRVEYLDGPFSRLLNQWRFFEKGSQNSEIEFFIDYEFRNRMLGLVMGSVFDSAFRKFAEAFERRADVVYARSSKGEKLTQGVIQSD